MAHCQNTTKLAGDVPTTNEDAANKWGCQTANSWYYSYYNYYYWFLFDPQLKWKVIPERRHLSAHHHTALLTNQLAQQDAK